MVAGLGLASPAGLQGQNADARLPACPNFIVVNSYSPGYPWSEDEYAGLVRALHTRFTVVEPTIVYLDTKRFTLAGRENLLLEDLAAKCRERPPKLVVTLDNAAFDFVLKHRERIAPGIPVVFGGLNRFDPDMLAGQKDITGVSEESDFRETFALLRHLKPGTKKILVINTRTESGRESRKVFEENLTAADRKDFEFEYFEDWTNEQLIAKAATLREGTVGFLLETSRDADGKVNYNDSGFTEALANASRVPLFVNSRPPGSHDWSVEPWLGVGGGMVRADTHGEKVGELAGRVLAGEAAGSIPVVQRTPTVSEVDYRHMKRLGLSLALLPPHTRVINAPESYYRVNQSRIVAVVLVVLFLMVVIVSMYINLEKRKRAEKALLMAQGELELLASAMSQASDVILILDEHARVRYANGAYERVTGHSTAAARHHLFDTLWTPPNANPSFESLRFGLIEHGLWSGVFELVLPPDRHVRLQVSLSPLRGDHGSVSHFLFMGRDTTREMLLQAQVHSSQKMEAVGMLAGGIAHDFNNILQVIRGECSMLTEAPATMEEMLQGLGLIGGAADRAAQLTQQLLVFSRKQGINPACLDPNGLVADWLKIVRRLIGEHIEVVFTPLARPSALMADRGQIEQVLLNLCVNARDAMPAGGRLAITMSRETLAPSGPGGSNDRTPGDYVCIEVSDTGVGMSPEVAGRVFEPFFTTKPLGKGTGLGLAVAYGIVEQHHGFITVQSTLGTGTIFRIYLPVDDSCLLDRNSNDVHREPQGSGLVLVAEDDEQVRSLAGRMLTRNGFEVVTASDGAIAIALIDQHAVRLRLVVLDVLMPALSGPAVYAHIKNHYPQIPVLFCSGYSSEALPPEMTPEAGLAYLNKPYSPAELLRSVHRLLDHPRGS